MQDIHTPTKTIRKTAWLLMLCLCLAASSAMADGVMPKMPEPPKTPVYWQLVSITHTPEVAATGGYGVSYEVNGLTPDLSDGLLTESLMMDEASAQGITLTIERGGETAMEHRYEWTALPIYMVPDTDYTIEIKGTDIAGEGSTPNSLMAIYVLGDRLARISAGGYTGHADSFTFDIGPNVALYEDGSIVVDFLLRDVNDMFRDHIVFTYEMKQGVRPVPTPIPGFVPADLPEGFEVPSHYVPVEGREGLWQIITAPDEYRAYGFMSGSGPSFFPADEHGRVVMDERPADPQKDFDAHVSGFVAETPETVPPQYTDEGDGKYSFITRDGETILRVYGRIDGQEPGFYPIDEEGEVPAGAGATTPNDDFEAHVRGFGAADPGELPAHYEIVGEGVYAFDARDGERYYRAYGRLHGEEPAFYPADAEGNVQGDAQAVTPQADFDGYIKGFDPAKIATLPAHYYIIEENLYAVDDREGAPVHRVYGVKDGQAPAFYPADAQGNVAEDAAPVDPAEDYTAYVEGFVMIEAPEPPAFYEITEAPGVYGFIDKDDQPHYRVYGSLHRGEPAFYPSDAEGNVAGDALPVQPASDLTIMPPPVFVPATPEQAFVPAHYEIVDGRDGLYTYKDMNGEPVYRVYGAFGKGAEGFFPADDGGEAVQGSDAIDPDEEYDDKFGAFVPQAAEDVPARYSAVEGSVGLYTFLDKEFEPVYRVFGATGDGEAAFYPADAEGNILSGEAVDYADDTARMRSAAVNVVATPVPAPSAANTPIARSEHGNPWTDLLVTGLPPVVSTIAPTAEPTGTNASVTRLITAPPANIMAQMGTELVSAVAQRTLAPSATPEVVSRVMDFYLLPTEPPVLTTAGVPVKPTEVPATAEVTKVAAATELPLETLAPAITAGVTDKPTEATATAETTVATLETQLPLETLAPVTPSPATEEPVTEPPVTEAPVTESPTTEPPATEAPTPAPTPEPEPQGGITTPGWIAIIAAAVAALGGGGYAIWRRRKK